MGASGEGEWLTLGRMAYGELAMTTVRSALPPLDPHTY